VTDKPDPSRGIYFVYDGDCPLCTSAALALRIKQDYGTLNLINAREAADHPHVRELTRRGLDLDEGMAIFADGRIYHGADALGFMARYGETRNAFMAERVRCSGRRNFPPSPIRGSVACAIGFCAAAT
jgi:hypothetical protein